MTGFVLYEPALVRIEDIYDYSLRQWGQVQADLYLDGLFATFAEIADRQSQWRPTPSEYRWNGYFRRYRRHIIFWRENGDGKVGIVTVLHDQMDLSARLREDIEAVDL